MFLYNGQPPEPIRSIRDTCSFRIKAEKESKELRISFDGKEYTNVLSGVTFTLHRGFTILHIKTGTHGHKKYLLPMSNRCVDITVRFDILGRFELYRGGDILMKEYISNYGRKKTQ